MSKIPQGEWNAIAARYAEGESISRIAQSYGCTPPAIHYILKRNKQRTTLNREQPRDEIPPSWPTMAVDRARGAHVGRPALGEELPGRAPLLKPQTADDPLVPPVRPVRWGQTARELIQSQPTNARNPAPEPRRSVGLDSDLQGRAEAAIEAFRSSFNAALAEGSPLVRQRLRQAAADLMRVAARTTIVLDQLNARADR